MTEMLHYQGDKPAQYLVYNKRTLSYLGDPLGGKTGIQWNGTRHECIGSADRAMRFTLDEAIALCFEHAEYSYCPVNPQTCDWF